jgi:hypothetical protein
MAWRFSVDVLGVGWHSGWDCVSRSASTGLARERESENPQLH